MNSVLNAALFMLPLVVAAAIFYVYLRINYPWLFWRRPAPQLPEAPEKRRRPGWLARQRAKTGAHHGKHRWSIGYSNPILPATVKLDDLLHHTLICGATGSGKTSAIQLLIDAVAGQVPVIVVDCKASPV
jgi:hypothetical protein